jgi:hypothetical protein
MSLGGKGVPIGTPLGRITTKLAKDVADTSTSTFIRGEKIFQAGLENPNNPEYAKLAEDYLNGKVTANKAYNRLRKSQDREKKKAELAEAAEKLKYALPGKVTVINADCGKLEAIPIEDNSVDLIVTDPPYTKDQLHLFEDLAKLAAQKLKPGGSVIFYYGQLNQPQIHRIFDKYEGVLSWYWPLCVKHAGASSKIWSRSIWPTWKPMMWFAKGEESTLTSIHHHIDMPDSIESAPPDKDKHPWAQSPISLHLLCFLTPIFIG